MEFYKMGMNIESEFIAFSGKLQLDVTKEGLNPSFCLRAQMVGVIG